MSPARYCQCQHFRFGNYNLHHLWFERPELRDFVPVRQEEARPNPHLREGYGSAAPGQYHSKSAYQAHAGQSDTTQDRDHGTRPARGNFRVGISRSNSKSRTHTRRKVARSCASATLSITPLDVFARPRTKEVHLPLDIFHCPFSKESFTSIYGRTLPQGRRQLVTKLCRCLLTEDEDSIRPLR